MALMSKNSNQLDCSKSESIQAWHKVNGNRAFLLPTVNVWLYKYHTACKYDVNSSRSLLFTVVPASKDIGQIISQLWTTSNRPVVFVGCAPVKLRVLGAEILKAGIDDRSSVAQGIVAKVKHPRHRDDNIH